MSRRSKGSGLAVLTVMAYIGIGVFAPNVAISSVGAAPAVTVSVSDTSVASGDTVRVPVNLSDVAGPPGIRSAEMELTYNPAVLAADTVLTDSTLVEGWQVMFTIQPGQVRIAAAGVDSLSGDGVLVYVVFIAVGTPGDTTVVHFAHLMPNEGDPPVTGVDGLLEVIYPSGLVQTIEPGAGFEYEENEVTLRGEGIDSRTNVTFIDTACVECVFALTRDSIDSVSIIGRTPSSIPQGVYHVAATSPSGMDTLRAAYRVSFRGDVVINFEVDVGDVIRVIRMIVHIVWPWGWYEGQSADVNNDALVNVLDVVTMINWVLGGGLPPPPNKVAEVGAPLATATVWLPETVNEEELFNVPIMVEVSEDIIGAEIHLRCDASVWSLQAPKTTVRSAGMEIAYNAVEDGEVVLVMYTLDGKTIAPGDAPLVEMPFERLGRLVDRGVVSLEEIILVDRYGRAMDTILAASVSTLRARVPVEYALAQNYPNPFNPNTVIQYQLPQSSEVALDIYNASGQWVRRLVRQTQMAGYHSAVWDGKDAAGHPVASGIYFYRLHAADFADTKKMVLVR